MLKRILQFGLLVLIVLVGILLLNTFNFKSKQIQVASEPSPTLSKEALERFTKAIQIKTISFGDSIPPDSTAFLDFHN